jgi:outer membrane protein
MKRSCCIAATLLVLVASGRAISQDTDSMTVDEAVRMAIERHPLMQQASQAVRAARARVEQSRSGYYPVIDASLSYTRIGPVPELSLPGFGQFKLYPEDNYDEHIALGQTIYDFGKTDAAVELGRAGVESAHDNRALIRTDLAFQTIQSFYAILFLRRSIGVQDQQIRALGEHLSVTEKKSETGSATDFDVLTTKVRIAAAINTRTDLMNDLEKQLAAFRGLLDLPPRSVTRLRGEFDASSVAPNADSLIALALSQRTELKQSRDAERTAALQERVATLRDRPVLRANLEYGAKNGYIPNLDVQRGNWVLGVQASIPIFDGFQTSSAEREARAGRRAAEARTRQVERLVVTEVQQAMSDVQTAAVKIETSKVQVEQANQAVDMARIRYESGVATNLDLIDAEAALAEARLSHLQSLYRYVMSRYALERAAGGNLEGH